MRRTLLVMACGLVGLCGGRVHAAINTGDRIDISVNNISSDPGGEYSNNNTYRYDGSGGGANGANGGEFLIRKIASLTPAETYVAGEEFKTFCIEKSENISLGGNYWVTIDFNALNGGVGPAGDPIDAATAWLFGTYSNSWLNDFTLAGGVYTYAYNNDAWAGFLQEAIWHLEGDFGGPLSAQAQALVNSAMNPSALSASNEIKNTLYDVRALNLWTTRSGTADNYTYSGLAQSQLILRGSTTPNSTVPEPATIMVWGGLAAIGLVAMRRKSAGSK